MVMVHGIGVHGLAGAAGGPVRSHNLLRGEKGLRVGVHEG